MRNEQGFTYPLTLAVLLLFIMVFTFRVEQILSEKKLAHETEKVLQEEYYFHSTVRKVEKIMQSTGTIPPRGTFPYRNGNMEYQAELPIGTTQKINFTLKMKSGGTLIGRGYFEINSKRLIKWTEFN